MDRATYCPYCKKHYVEEVNNKGEYECLECGAKFKDTKSSSIINIEYDEEYIYWFYTNGIYNDYDGLLKPRY